MTPNDRTKLRDIALDRLESLQQAGVLQLPRFRDRAPLIDDTVAPPLELTQAQSTLQQESGISEIASAESEMRPPVTNAEKERTEPMPKKSSWQAAAPTSLFEAPAIKAESTTGLTLEVLQQQVAACTRCNELATTRTQTVFGVGNPKARICFLGEAPGADEDKTGIPFVGRGGQLLTKIIEACHMKREDVYILNMIKCRPPGNRNPLPQELGNCRGYLESQLDLIQPEFICCLGAVASQNLLGTTVAIGKLRGKLHAFRGAKVVCTYHPAFLLRSPSFKKETWEDMKLLMREMGVEL
jgi:uracil-DNA glycosylase family 4